MYDDLDDHHPACRCGCGELADECGRLTRRAVTAVRDVPGPVWIAHDDHLHRMTCRWRRCTEPVDRFGLCESHLDTL